MLERGTMLEFLFWSLLTIDLFFVGRILHWLYWQFRYQYVNRRCKNKNVDFDRIMEFLGDIEAVEDLAEKASGLEGHVRPVPTSRDTPASPINDDERLFLKIRMMANGCSDELIRTHLEVAPDGSWDCPDCVDAVYKFRLQFQGIRAAPVLIETGDKP